MSASAFTNNLTTALDFASQIGAWPGHNMKESLIRVLSCFLSWLPQTTMLIYRIISQENDGMTSQLNSAPNILLFSQIRFSVTPHIGKQRGVGTGGSTHREVVSSVLRACRWFFLGYTTWVAVKPLTWPIGGLDYRRFSKNSALTVCFVPMQYRWFHPWNQDTSLIRTFSIGPI